MPGEVECEVPGLDFLPEDDDILFFTQPLNPVGDWYHFPLLFAGTDWAPVGADITDYVCLFV